MKYLIPSWYQETHWWRDRAVPFYEMHHVTEFDDMVSLCSMFQQHAEDFEIICLNYHSELRNFLYRNGLFESQYWSVFDMIQGFEDAIPKPIDYRDLQWPKGTEFMEMPYMVKAYTTETTVSNIYVSQEGYLTWIEDKENGYTLKRYVFDDRGFLSSVVYFDAHGQPSKIVYLDAEGDAVMTENINTGHVAIAHKSSQRFQQTEYASMTTIIQECLAAHFENNEKQAAYIAASDSRHNALLTEIIPYEQLTFSLFSKRQPDLNQVDISTLLSAKHWLVDSKQQVTQLKAYLKETHQQVQIMHHTPFPTEVLPNISSQLQETEIGCVIDGLSLEHIFALLDVLVPYVEDKENFRLVLITRAFRHAHEAQLKARIEEVNKQLSKRQSNYALSDETQDSKRIRFESVPFEIDVLQLMATLRIIIDLNQEPDLFIQISSVSAGIPQINRISTPYMKDKANGLLVENNKALPYALNTFLVGLKRWNFAFAYSVQLVETYASDQLVQQINRLVEGAHYGTKI